MKPAGSIILFTLVQDTSGSQGLKEHGSLSVVAIEAVVVALLVVGTDVTGAF